MKKILYANIPLFICLVVLAAAFVFTAGQKKGTFVDEMLTFDLANRESDRVAFMLDFLGRSSPEDWGDTLKNIKENGWSGSSIYRDFKAAQQAAAPDTLWRDGSYFSGTITAGEGSRFDFLSVLYNSVYDSHPPFYYYWVHLISSLFPGVFSLWLGLSVNILFQLLSCSIFYLIVKRFFGGTGFATFMTLVFGLSSGCLSTVLIIRMYSMLLFFVLAFLYINLRVAENGFVFTKRLKRMYIAAAVLGFYTQYFFAIYAFLLVACTLFYLVIQKDKRKLLGSYLIHSLTAGVISLIIFPFSLKHIFFDSFGQSTFKQLTESNLLESIGAYLGLVMQYMWANGFVSSLIFLLLFGSLFWLLTQKRRALKTWLGGKQSSLFFLTALPALLYFLVVAGCAPFISDRYIMCIYPLILLPVFYTLWRIFALKTVYAFPLVCCIGALLTGAGLFLSPPAYLFGDQGGKIALETEGENTICVYVGENNGWKYKTCLRMMSRLQATAILLEDQIGQLPEGSPAPGQYSQVIVCVDKSFDQEVILKQIEEEMKLTVTKTKRLNDANDEYAAMYLLSVD